MDRVKLPAMRRQELQRVRLVELVGVSFLRDDIHADDVEPGVVVSFGSSTGT